MMSRGGGPPLAPQLIRDARVEILEALEWLGQPLSIKTLMRVLDCRRSASALAYHLSRLVDGGGLGVVATGKAMGSFERFYFFPEWDYEAVA